MIFTKLFLAGLAFSFYCYSSGRKDKTAVLAGTIAYTFSGAILFTVARHPNYINWAYFLPFLLGGVEIYCRKKKKLPLVLFVVWNIVTSYYTFYMNIILVALYVISHSVCNLMRNKSVRALLRELQKGTQIAGVCFTGILLSMCFLLPTIYAYLTNARAAAVSGYTDSILHYPMTYYGKLLEDLFAAYISPGYYTYVGFNAVIVVPLILIFIQKKKNSELKVLISLSFLMLCIPMAGRIMNGFGYACNRWSYAISFYASYAFVTVFRQIQEMTIKEKLYVYMIVITYIAGCYLHIKTNSDIQKCAALVIILWVIVMIGISLHYKLRQYDKFLIGLVMAGACFQIYFTFSINTGNYVSSFCDRDKISTCFENYSSTAAAKLSDEFYRVEKEENRSNTDGYNKIHGTSFFWSMLPSYVLEYYKDLSLDTVHQNCNFYGLDGRTGLLLLASVKYYTRPTKSDGFIPYGYKEIESPISKFQIFENPYALPIGYTYSKYIAAADYENMDGIEKEQAMLQGAVIGKDLEGFEKANIVLSYNLLPYEINQTTNVTLENNLIKVMAANGTIELKTDIPEDCEIYVHLRDMELLGSTADIDITAARENGSCRISKSAKISNLNYNWPVIRDDVAYNLGSGYSGENTITLTFSGKGTFSFNEIQIVAVPMSAYETYATELGKYVLENVHISNDTVKGIISVPEKRILQFSIPYSIGWTAYVDGEKTEIMKSDVMYMAISLPAGFHKIELEYKTPYLMQGIAITAITLIAWIIWEIVKKRRNHNAY